MLRRFLLGFTFLAAFTTLGVGVPDTAEAWRRWGRPTVSYYYGPPRSYYYGTYTPYRTYYGSSYYRPYYGRSYYSDPYYYHYGPRRGAWVSFSY